MEQKDNITVYLILIITQKIKFKFNFLSIWDWNISEVHAVYCMPLPRFKLNILLLKGIAQ